MPLNPTDYFKVEKLARKSAQNSPKLCAEFASYVRRIVKFLAQNSDNPTPVS